MQTGFIPGAMIGAPGGVAELDQQGKLLAERLPPITPAAIGAEPAGAAANAIATHLTNAPHLTSVQIAAITQSAIAAHEKSLPHLSAQTVSELALAGATEAVATHLKNVSHLSSAQVESIAAGLITALKKETDPFPQYKYPGDLGGKKNTRGITPPVNPSIGDTFEEITATGQWVMSWFWNGTYWLSTQIIFKEASLISLSNSVAAFYEISNAHNIFVLWFKCNALLGATNGTNNQWAFNLFCATSAATGAFFLGSSVGSGTNAPNTWYTSIQSLNTHVNVGVTSAKAFILQATKNGLPSTINGSMQVAYRLARV